MPLYPGSSFFPGGGVVQPALQLEGVVRVAPRYQDAPQHEDLPFGEGTVTATVTDGSGLSEAFAVDYDEDDGVGEFTIPVSLTDTCRPLRVEWAHAPSGQQFVSTVDVRDGQPFPSRLLERILRTGAENDDGGLADFPAWARREAMSDALLVLERYCNTALVPRRSTVEIAGPGTGTSATLEHANLRRVVATSVDSINPADCRVSAGGLITFPSAVAAPLTVTVEHGEIGPAPDIAMSIALIAAERLRDGAWDDRGYTMSQDGQFVALLTAGVRGATFSIPSVEVAYKRARILEIG